MPIGEALDFIRKYVEDNANEAMEPKVSFTPRPNTALGDQEIGMIISLINIEEERSLKQPYKYERIPNTQPAIIAKLNPDIDLNLYVLFSACYTGGYGTCLLELSELIKIFANKNVFTKEDIENTMTDGDETILSKIILDLHTMSLDQMSNLWQGLGSNFYPSVMYKVRVVTVKPTAAVNTTTEVVSIAIES